MFVSATDYIALPHADTPWWIEGLLPTGGMLLVYGKPKGGKSWAVLTLVTALLNKWPTVFGLPVMAFPKKIAYLQSDTPRSEWRERILGIQAVSQTLDGLYIADTLLAPYPFNIQNKDPGQAHQWLTAATMQLDPDIVVIDTFRDIFNGDENDASVMRNVVGALREATQQKTIILIAHARKTQQAANMIEADLMEDMRGSSYVVGKVDAIAKMSMNDKTHEGYLSFQSRAWKRTDVKVMMEDTYPHFVLPNIDAKTIELEKARELVLRHGNKPDKAIAQMLIEVRKEMTLRTAQRRVADARKLLEGDTDGTGSGQPGPDANDGSGIDVVFS